MKHVINLTEANKKKLSEDFQKWSKRTRASETEGYPTYSAMYSWINGPTKLTLEKLQTLCDNMNKEWEVDGFKVFRVRESRPEDYVG